MPPMEAFWKTFYINRRSESLSTRSSKIMRLWILGCKICFRMVCDSIEKLHISLVVWWLPIVHWLVPDWFLTTCSMVWLLATSLLCLLSLCPLHSTVWASLQTSMVPPWRIFINCPFSCSSPSSSYDFSSFLSQLKCRFLREVSPAKRSYFPRRKPVSILHHPVLSTGLITIWVFPFCILTTYYMCDDGSRSLI